MKAFRIILSIFVPIFLICLCVSELYKWNYIQHEQHIPNEFNVPELLYSGNDADRDGVDDIPDVYQGAVDYVATKPKYKYKEYVGGWPDDKFGIDTDVIDRALLAGGYDMQKLVWQDIQLNPDKYPENPGTEDTAFRNVKNLEIFMSRYFSKYTTDYEDKNKREEWQEGDIIFFEKGHTAIVADKLNNDGIRFIIHHFSSLQWNYYQDVLDLGAWGKVTGHYRVNPNALAPKKDTEQKVIK